MQPVSRESESPFITLGAIARLCGVSRQAARYWQLTGKLKPFGRTSTGVFLFERNAVLEFIRARQGERAKKVSAR